MSSQVKLNPAVTSHRASSPSADTPTIEFGRITNIYASLEIVAVGAVAFAAAIVYWRSTFNVLPDVGEALVPSILIALIIGTIEISAGRMSLAPLPGPAFLWAAVRTTLKAFALLIAVFFLLKVSGNYSRGTVISQFVSVTLLLLAMRAGFQTFLRARLSEGRLETDRIVVIGALAHDRAFLSRLSKNGARIVHAASFQKSSSEAVDTASILKGLVETCRSLAVNQVVIAPSADDGELSALMVNALAETPVTVHVVPPGVETPVFRRGSDSIGGMPTAIVHNRPLTTLDITVKRSFDIAVSMTALVLLAPLFLMVAIAIRIDSKGPVFFRQTRHGYGKSAIRVFKFRSMSVMEDGNAFRQATRNDPRITRVGQFIRRTNLDELPQLFNVLFGEMSIVGPRPHPVALNESFADRIKWFNRRHNIRPGITGWAQINGYRGETETVQKMAGRVEHDLWYLDNWSFYLDIKIMLLTVFSSVAYRDAR